MSLNINDPEAHQLAEAIARVTGESMTHVVTEALRDRYAKLTQQSAKASVEELLEIANRAAAYRPEHAPSHTELLYDERGLPK